MWPLYCNQYILQNDKENEKVVSCEMRSIQILHRLLSC